MQAISFVLTKLQVETVLKVIFMIEKNSIMINIVHVGKLIVTVLCQTFIQPCIYLAGLASASKMYCWEPTGAFKKSLPAVRYAFFEHHLCFNGGQTAM